MAITMMAILINQADFGTRYHTDDHRIPTTSSNEGGDAAHLDKADQHLRTRVLRIVESPVENGWKWWPRRQGTIGSAGNGPAISPVELVKTLIG